MRTVSYDNTFGMVDLAVYTELIADDNKDQINRLKRNLTRALRQDITKEFGVNKSTVSRTLKRGRQRLYRCLRYGAANLLEQANS